MKTGRPKEQGSIGTEGGRAMLGVSKKTREKINNLARKAKMPVSEYLKKLAETADEKQPESAFARAAIVEQLVNENERLDALNDAYKASLTEYERIITWVYKNVLLKKKPLDIGVRKTIKAIATKTRPGKVTNV